MRFVESESLVVSSSVWLWQRPRSDGQFPASFRIQVGGNYLLKHFCCVSLYTYLLLKIRRTTPVFSSCLLSRINQRNSVSTSQCCKFSKMIYKLGRYIQTIFIFGFFQRKPALIYIHDDNSVTTQVFCTQVLCAPAMVDFINSNFIMWGWDFTLAENRTKCVTKFSNYFA